MTKRLVRSRQDRMVAGVAGGMGDYFAIDPTIVRLIWLLLFLPGGLPGLLLYVICWVVIPPAPEPIIPPTTGAIDGPVARPATGRAEDEPPVAM